MSYTGTKAQAGRGSSLTIGAVVLGEITDVPFEAPKWNLADATNFQSGSDSEQIVTIRQPASFTLKGNRVSGDAGQIAAVAAYSSGTLSSFVITLPKTATQTTTGDTVAFSGYIVSQSFPITATGIVSFSLDITTSGAVTYTTGT